MKSRDQRKHRKERKRLQTASCLPREKNYIFSHKTNKRLLYRKKVSVTSLLLGLKLGYFSYFNTLKVQNNIMAVQSSNNVVIWS